MSSHVTPPPVNVTSATASYPFGHANAQLGVCSAHCTCAVQYPQHDNLCKIQKLLVTSQTGIHREQRCQCELLNSPTNRIHSNHKTNFYKTGRVASKSEVHGVGD